MANLLDKVIPSSTPRASNKKAELINVFGDWSLPSLWAMKYRMLKGKSQRFTSKKDLYFHRPWQIQPLDDMAPTIVVKKGRQMG